MCGALSISTPLPPAASSVQNTSTIKPPPAKQHRNSKKKIEIALRARTQFQVDFRFAFNCWVLFRDVCQLLSIYWLAHTVRSRYRVEKRKKRKGFVFLCSAQYTDDPPSLRYNNRKKIKTANRSTRSSTSTSECTSHSYGCVLCASVSAIQLL